MSPALTEAICPNGRPAPVDEIRITIDGARFRWSLWRAGREVFAGFGDAAQVSGMTRATEQLVNSELGVAPAIGTSRPKLN